MSINKKIKEKKKQNKNNNQKLKEKKKKKKINIDLAVLPSHDTATFPSFIKSLRISFIIT